MTQRKLKKGIVSQAARPHLLASISIFLALGACTRTAPGVVPPRAEPPPATYDEEVVAAEAMSDRGDWERALKLADALVAAHPERARAYLARGRALALGDQLEASAAAYEKAYPLGDRSPRLYAELTSANDVLGRYEASARLYREYLAQIPDDVEMRQQLALTVMLANKPAEAAGELEKLHDPSLSAPHALAVAEDLALAWFRSERVADAESLARSILARASRRPAALRLLAEIDVRRGDLVGARAHLEEAVPLDPKEPSARRLRAQLRLAFSDAAGAREDYGTLWRVGYRDAGVLLGLAGSLILTGEMTQAEEALARARNLGIDSPSLALREAQLRRRQGDPAALDMIEAFAKAHPQNVDVWQELLAAGREQEDPVLIERARTALAGLGVVVTK